MALIVSGSLPSVMWEGSGAGDWFGSLQLTPDRGTIAGVEAIGPGAPYLSLSWHADSSTVWIQPGAVADYEGFVAQGLPPELDFSLSVTMKSGRVDTSTPGYTIGLLDRDDTPPSGLSFASGGSVYAGAIGAVIGTLHVTDPDTPAGSPFFFSFAEDDDWRFEIVDGSVLKLRDGITLGLDDIPTRPLLLTVSDGTQSAGFTLDLTVLDPDAPPPPSRLLAVGEARGAVALPTAEHAMVLKDSGALLDLAAPAAGERAILVRGEADAALPEATHSITFTDARLELGGGSAAQAEALRQALDGTARPDAVARDLAALEAGAALVDQVTAVAHASDEAFVTQLYRQVAGRDPDAGELDLQLGRLGSGESAAQVAVDVAMLLAPGTADPLWLPWTHGHDAPAADAALPAAPAAPIAADLLLG